jgi:hypothetical protein
VIGLKQLQFDVTTSRVDITPILIIDENPYNQLTLVNQGWGPAKDTYIDLIIRSSDVCDTDPWLLPTEHHVDIGLVNESSTINIKPLVPAEYISSDPKTRAFVCVGGYLSFADESGKAHKVKFKTRVQVSGPLVAPALIPGADYHVCLQAGVTGRKLVPIAYELLPGRADQFLIRIGTNKSADFDFRLSAITVGNDSLPLKRVLLNLIVPRQEEETVQRLAQQYCR